MCGIFRRSLPHIQSLSKTKELNKLNGSLEVLENFTEVWAKIHGDIMDKKVKHEQHISLKNIGLDLEKMLPDLGNYIESQMNQGKRPDLSYCGLIINPESDLIKAAHQRGKQYYHGIRQLLLCSIENTGKERV